MTDVQRGALAQAARRIAADMQAGNAAAVRAVTIAPVASQFDGIAATIQTVHPEIEHALVTVNALYLLNATDLRSTEDTQFFCALPGSQMTVTFSIPQLPPGNYGFVLVHATGVDQPQQLSMVLENDPAGSSSWKLAGFFVRPLLAAGHDGLWYWRAARDYAKKKQNWNAWFYYQTATPLLAPVDFLSSPNLDKLRREAQAVHPEELPGQDPMELKAGGQSFSITNITTDGSLGGLDLVITYKAAGATDPVAARAQVVMVMKAMLEQHPELRQAFHGLWVYAAVDGQHPFALELPMDQIS
uniref:Uncharacterized protein n=2 Tax=Paracidobacterium acidisoli TaxID=2303751 RepID=A0A372ITM2_9BACT